MMASDEGTTRVEKQKQGNNNLKKKKTIGNWKSYAKVSITQLVTTRHISYLF